MQLSRKTCGYYRLSASLLQNKPMLTIGQDIRFSYIYNFHTYYNYTTLSVKKKFVRVKRTKVTKKELWLPDQNRSS